MATDPNHGEYKASILAARMGLFWWDLDPDHRQSFVDLSNEKLDRVTEALLEAATNDDLESWLKAGASAWDRCQRESEAPREWIRLRESLDRFSLPNSWNTPPWKVGWQAAGHYREVLELASSKVIDSDDLGAGFIPAIFEEEIDESTVVAWSAGRMPVRIPEKLLSPGPGPRRFSHARDLFPILFEAGPQSDYARVFSRRILGSRAVANAFAAELLAPAGFLRKRIVGTPDVDTDLLAEIAGEIGAPVQCVIHQIENHEIATITDSVSDECRLSPEFD